MLSGRDAGLHLVLPEQTLQIAVNEGNAVLPGVHTVDEKAVDAVLEALAGDLHPGLSQMLGKLLSLGSQAVIPGGQCKA